MRLLRPEADMIRIGLTGGIGSGKSTVAKVWAELGADVIDADSLAKEIMATDPEVRSRIAKTFGPSAYRSDGSLDRGWLAHEAFHKGRVQALNDIVHPVVKRRTERLFKQAERDGRPACVKEAALLLENGRPENLDAVVVVAAPLEDRIRRAAERDHVTEQAVRLRAQRQSPQEAMLAMADHVLVNDRDVDSLREAAKALARELFLRSD